MANRDEQSRTCRDPTCDQHNPQSVDQFSKQGWICSTCRKRNKKTNNERWIAAHPGDRARRAKEWRTARKEAGLPVRDQSEDARKRHNEEAKRRYADPEISIKIKERQRAYRIANPEKVKQANKEWREKNLIKSRQYHKEYARKRWYDGSDWRNRQLDAKTLWRHRNWQQVSNGLGWKHVKNDEVITNEYRQRLAIWQNGRCYICNKISPILTDEHLFPRSLGGASIEQNCVKSCPSCNFSRQAKLWGIEWEPSSIEATDDVFLKWRTITAALINSGIEVTNHNEYFHLNGPRGERHLYVLSTFNGSERNVGAGRIIKKTLEKDTAAIVILDREWYDRQGAVINMLRSKLGLMSGSAGARKFEVLSVGQPAANAFLNNHHVMGKATGIHRIALCLNDEIHGLGVFVDHGDFYECVRLAFHNHIPGGMSRIIDNLLKLHGKKPILSFVDSRYATGNGHETIGFKDAGTSGETYLWVLPIRMQHQRYFSNDNKMSRNLLWFSKDHSKDAVMRANGIFKIWLPEKRKIWLDK